MPDAEPTHDVRLTELVVRGPNATLLSSEELDLSWRIASALAKSGMFKDARQAEQALAKILLGRDLGLSPTQAMTGIHLVEGKPMVAAVTLGAFVKQHKNYDYAVTELTNEKCVIAFYEDGEECGTSEFTMEDAKLANLVKDGSGWKKFPRNMLFARALSNGVRWFAPDATHGVPVYHEGEIEQLSSLTAPGEQEPPDFGENPEVEQHLRDLFSELEYTLAKQRTVLRGCTSDEARGELVKQLMAEAGWESMPTEATVVEEETADASAA